MLSQILVGLLTGSVGVGYFMYGKKRSRFVPMLAGAALCLYPYAVRTCSGCSLSARRSSRCLSC